MFFIWLFKQVTESSLVSLQWIMRFSYSEAFWGCIHDYEQSIRKTVKKWQPAVPKCVREGPLHMPGCWAEWHRPTVGSASVDHWLKSVLELTLEEQVEQAGMLSHEE